MLESPKPLLCLIPGGPGLSASSLGELRLLRQSFDCVVLEPASGDVTFDEVVVDLETQVQSVKRPVILVGNSFGGFYAAALVARANVDIRAWVGLATCATAQGWAEFSARLPALRTPERAAAEGAFFSTLAEDDFRKWLLSLLAIYFHPKSHAKGTQLFAAMGVCPRSFVSVNQSLPADFFQTAAEVLKSFTGKKLLIAAEEDPFFAASHVQADAAAIGAMLIPIPDAHHFVTIDNEVALTTALQSHF